MLKLGYTSIDFPARFKLNGTCKFTWAELIWAAITVGKAERSHLMRFGRYSLFELVSRVSIIYANLTEGYDSNLYRSEVYDALDPSEKGAISYFLGLTAAKLLAEKLLDVSWLMHLDVYRDQLSPSFWRGKSRPDLVGWNKRREWVVIEAKGRTHGLNNGILSKAKDQTRNLRKVAGDFPVLRVALASHFSYGCLKAAIQDPEDFNDNSPDLDISLESMLAKYYEPFIHLLKDKRSDGSSEKIGNKEYLTSKIEDADITVGIDSLIFNAKANTDILDIIMSQDEKSHPESEKNYILGSDGIFVRLGNSWNSDKMILQPQKRYVQ